jgi:CBS domain-containing protein
VHRVIVWEDGGLCGIVSSLDVVRVVAERGFGGAERG